MTIVFNIGSLIIGFAALIFAFLAIASKKSQTSHRLSVGSFSLCAFSLILQLLEINNRVNIRDFSAIEDTIRAVIIAAFVLVIITVAMNIVAAAKRR